MRLNKRFLILLGIFLVVATISLRIFLDSIYCLPILMYHAIDYASDKKDRMTVSPEAFARHMKYLHDNKYNVIPLEKAVLYIKEKKRPPAKTIVITFDDGYENNYRYAYPVLKRYNTPATIFVIVDLVEIDGFLNWDEIKEMSDSNVIDIESHTESHLWLTGLDDNVLKHELESSKAILEKRLGKAVNFLCYPMGGYNEHVESAVKAAGYKAAFATKPTKLFPNYDIYAIKRVRISSTSNNLFVFVFKLSGYHAFLRIIQNDYLDIPFVRWKKRSSS